MSFQSKFVWMEGELVPFAEAKLHFLTSSLHYGTAIFEGIRAYSTADGPAVFRLTDHIERLFKSAQILGIKKNPYTVDQIVQAVHETIHANEFDECYIRPLIYIKTGGWNLTTDHIELGLGIAVWEWKTYLGEEALLKGIRANIASFTRHHPNITLIKGKIAGNYVNSILAKTESVRNGYDEAIMLDPEGYVAECTGENIFIVRNGVIYTTERQSILEGITRDSILALATYAGLPIVETKLSRDQLYLADEVFVTGTAAEVIALAEIDHRIIGNGTTGPICKQLQKAYQEVIHGENKNFHHWLEWVKPAVNKQAKSA